jgi:hypothetical protein
MTGLDPGGSCRVSSRRMGRVALGNQHLGGEAILAPRFGGAYGRVLAASGAMLAFLAATNVWVSWHTAIYQFRSFDDINYRAMAAAAPGLLHTRIPEWHAERFAIEWLIGSAAKLFSIALEASFWGGIALAVFATCWVLADVLIRSHLSVPAVIVCIGVFVLNPYTIRPYLIGPGGVADLVFVLGAAICIRGLVGRVPLLVLGGLLLGTIARQTMLPAALVAAGAVAIDPGWRLRLGRSRLPFAAALIVLPVACYAAVRIVSNGFSDPAPSLSTISLLGANLSLRVLGQHFARCVNGLLSAGALLACASWALRRERHAGSNPVPSSARNMHSAYACLAFGAAIVIQPAVLNPAWAADNETRLAVLGLVPLVVALALIMRELELARASPLPARVAIALVALLALGSLHHINSQIGPANKVETLVLQVVIAATLGIIILRRTPQAVAAVGRLSGDESSHAH